MDLLSIGGICTPRGREGYLAKIRPRSALMAWFPGLRKPRKPWATDRGSITIKNFAREYHSIAMNLNDRSMEQDTFRVLSQ